MPWLTVIGGASGAGPGTVFYLVAATTSGVPRAGTLTIDGQTLTVVQDAGVCAFTLDPGSVSAPSGSSAGGLTVHTGTGCAWTAVSGAPWITVTAGASGSGTGTVGLLIAANPGPAARTGTVAIADQTFTASQAAPPVCSFSLAPTGASFGHGGGTGSFKVFVGSGCSWTATSNAPWLQVTGGGGGTANGTVVYTVAVNTPKVQRTGTITVANRQFTVTQAP